MNRTPIPPKTHPFQDVTTEYLRAAVPGTGSVVCEEGYRIKDHQHEIAMAQWLFHTFGGDVILLKESEIKHQKMADFLWNQKLWELKSVSSINGADKLTQHAIKQIQDHPGGDHPEHIRRYGAAPIGISACAKAQKKPNRRPRPDRIGSR